MQALYQNNSFQNLSEDLNMHSFCHKTQSFRHNLNIASNQKNYFTRVVYLYSAIKEMISEDLNLHLFGHKTHSFHHNLNHAPNKSCSARISAYEIVSSHLVTKVHSS
jgi:hypothetical protein